MSWHPGWGVSVVFLCWLFHRLLAWPAVPVKRLIHVSRNRLSFSLFSSSAVRPLGSSLRLLLITKPDRAAPGLTSRADLLLRRAGSSGTNKSLDFSGFSLEQCGNPNLGRTAGLFFIYCCIRAEGCFPCSHPRWRGGGGGRLRAGEVKGRWGRRAGGESEDLGDQFYLVLTPARPGTQARRRPEGRKGKERRGGEGEEAVPSLLLRPVHLHHPISFPPLPEGTPGEEKAKLGRTGFVSSVWLRS